MLVSRMYHPHQGSQIFARAAFMVHGIRFASMNKSKTNKEIFEPLPREELLTKFKSKLRDREFTPGSTQGGFPEFLAEPRDSLPLGVRVHNPNQASLAQLTAKCMEFMEENHSQCPAILFRGLPAQTADDFSTIAGNIPGKPLSYEVGGSTYRKQVDKSVKTYTASDDPLEVTMDTHNEMSYLNTWPKKVRCRERYCFCSCCRVLLLLLLLSLPCCVTRLKNSLKGGHSPS